MGIVWTEAPSTPGIYFDVPNALYHAGPGVSSTALRRLTHKTPAHHRAAVETAIAEAGKPEVISGPSGNGTLTHCAFLEPYAFASRYIVGPDENKNSNKWKAFVQEAQGHGLVVIDEAQREAAYLQSASLWTVPEVAELRTDGHCEVSAYWFDPVTGLLCKCRPDCLSYVAHGRGVVLLDVKTTKDASERAWAWQALSDGYDQQAAFYIDGFELASGLEVVGFVFGVVENTPPYAARAFMLDERDIQTGRELNRRALDAYAACLLSGDWYGYPSGITALSLPRRRGQ